MKKLLLIIVAFVFLFGAEFQSSKNSQNKIQGLCFSARATTTSSGNILLSSAFGDEDSNQQDIEQADNGSGFRPKALKQRFIPLQAEQKLQTQIRSFIFDLPPPYFT